MKLKLMWCGISLIGILLVISFVIKPSTSQLYVPLTAHVFPDARDQPPKNWKGPIFKLSQNYPKVLPTPEDYPWKKYNFKTQWREYMYAVLNYCYQGNTEVDWVVQKNKVRHWYHAPWLHWGRNGREFVHGMTYERPAQPGDLMPSQKSVFQNWAVGMYNAPGGYTFGQVWKDHNSPNPQMAKFPEGTVSIKLLFTQATVAEVPFLKGSQEWDANIYDIITFPTNPQVRRSIHRLRLLQIDIAVRDSRADDTTGWVFGTFTYDANAKGTTPWKRMVPVGLMWGNDPGITTRMTRSGTKLKESIINPSNIPFQHLGWSGRLAGPVDNPISSCLSCHSTAQWPVRASLVPTSNLKPDSVEWMQWFRNIKSHEPFTAGSQSLDYSLQLAAGLQNFYEWQELQSSEGGFVNQQDKNVPYSFGDSANKFRRDYPVTRSGE